jgi:hypothetical protein
MAWEPIPKGRAMFVLDILKVSFQTIVFCYFILSAFADFLVLFFVVVQKFLS